MIDDDNAPPAPPPVQMVERGCIPGWAVAPLTIMVWLSVSAPLVALYLMKQG